MEEKPVASEMLELRAKLRKNDIVKTSIIDDDREVVGTSCRMWMMTGQDTKPHPERFDATL